MSGPVQAPLVPLDDSALNEPDADRERRVAALRAALLRATPSRRALIREELRKLQAHDGVR